MADKYAKLQYDFAISEEGRFIPYIGKDYEDGLLCEYEKLKILIIGPRHYCDAKYNSRNVLIRKPSSGKKSKLKSGQLFPNNYEVGCTKRTPEECLKIETKICSEQINVESMCPVYKYTICPIIRNCNIQTKFGMKCKSRNLRCETLYAIAEFLKKPNIESTRLGISYFGQITEFIIKHFRPNGYDINRIWQRVAYFNLIQRYIPLKDINYNSDRIERRIKDYDINAARDIIHKLIPDVIITTMLCVSKKIQGILTEFGYSAVNKFDGYGYMLFRKNTFILTSQKPEWQEDLNRLVSDYQFPDISYKLREEICEIVKKIRDTYRSQIHGRSAENEIRKYVRQLFVKKIKDADNVSSSIRNIKCFNECCEKPDEAMRQWLKYKPDK